MDLTTSTSGMGVPNSLLGRYEDERPSAAERFIAALAIEPERSTFAVEGSAIELLT